MIRVVLDTNVLVSGLIAPGGAPATLLLRWLDGAFELVVSEGLPTEVRDVLERPKFRRYATSDDIGEFVQLLDARAVRVPEPAVGAGVSDDPSDDRIIALARDEAAVLVTGDEQVLGYRVPGLPILTPRAFLEALDG